MKQTKLSTKDALKLRLEENARKIDDFNDFALRCTDRHWQSFYSPTTSWGIAQNFNCTLSAEYVQSQYKNYLKANK
jgi:hypothetical protein